MRPYIKGWPSEPINLPPEKPLTLNKTQALSKRYGGKLAVNNVSFEVQAEEVYGFLGPNGAGKSTTIKMIVGLLQPTSGTVRVAGYEFQVYS